MAASSQYGSARSGAGPVTIDMTAVAANDGGRQWQMSAPAIRTASASMSTGQSGDHESSLRTRVIEGIQRGVGAIASLLAKPLMNHAESRELVPSNVRELGGSDAPRARAAESRGSQMSVREPSQILQRIPEPKKAANDTDRSSGREAQPSYVSDTKIVAAAFAASGRFMARRNAVRGTAMSRATTLDARAVNRSFTRPARRPSGVASAYVSGAEM